MRISNGSEIYRIETNLALADEFPFDVFYEESEHKCHVFDEGLTWHSLLVLSFNWQEKDQSAILASTVAEYGVDFKSGCFEIYGSKDKAVQVVESYLSAMSKIDELVVNSFGRGEMEEKRPKLSTRQTQHSSCFSF